MSDRIKSCKVTSNHPLTVFRDSEGGSSKYVLNNHERKSFNKIEFEKCVFKGISVGKRCDYGWTFEPSESTKTVVFIELKGGEVTEGIKQLLSTVGEVESCFKGFEKKARLIYSGKDRPVFSRNSKPYKLLAAKLNHNSHKDNLIIRNRLFEETI